MRLLSFLWLHLASALGTRGNVGVQLHSANDLLEWKAHAQKGGRSFKIDPHYVEALRCRLNGDHDPRGCLLLSHDAPLPGLLGARHYNSTSEIVDLVRRAGNYFPLGSSVAIALCFKSSLSLADVCNQSTAEARNWLSLVDDFVARANAAIKEAEAGGVTVEFVLDGAGQPIGCLAQRWRPWRSVWVQGDSPAEAFTSNDVSRGFDRFQILNNDANFSEWARISTGEVHYGKFQKQSAPFQLWEPDAQSDFWKFQELYMTAGAGLHAGGFNFAINIDPAMFATYSASRIGGGYNLNVTSADPAREGVVSRPAVTALAFEGAAQVLVVYQQRQGAEVELRLKSLRIQSLFQELEAADLVELELPNSTAVALASAVAEAPLSLKASKRADGGYWLLLSCGRAFQLYELLQADGPLRPVAGGTRLGSLAMALYSSEGPALATVELTDDQLCLVEKQRHCWKSPPLATSADLAIFQEGDELQALIVVATAAAETYVAMAMLGQEGTSRLLGFVLGGVGQRPQVGVGLDSGLLLVVNEGGYCQNSHSHNTRTAPRVCASAALAISTPHVLDYTYGTAGAWEQLLQAEPERAFSACNPDVLHGTFHLGSQPAGTVVSLDGTSAAMVVHLGLPAHAADGGGCGRPVSLDTTGHGVVMLESWPLWNGQPRHSKPVLAEV